MARYVSRCPYTGPLETDRHLRGHTARVDANGLCSVAARPRGAPPYNHLGTSPPHPPSNPHPHIPFNLTSTPTLTLSGCHPLRWGRSTPHWGRRGLFSGLTNPSAKPLLLTVALPHTHSGPLSLASQLIVPLPPTHWTPLLTAREGHPQPTLTPVLLLSTVSCRARPNSPPLLPIPSSSSSWSSSSLPPQANCSRSSLKSARSSPRARTSSPSPHRTRPLRPLLRRRESRSIC